MDLHKIAEFFGFKKRLIYRSDNLLYLTRYYIFRKPLPWLPSIYLHCFHASDEDEELHNHPWTKSLSFILQGSYREEYRDKSNKVRERILSPGKFNYITANKFHRVDLVTENVWTIFVSGRKVQLWGFWNRLTNEYVEQEEHHKRKKLKKNLAMMYIHDRLLHE